jgi:hypothetical protein
MALATSGIAFILIHTRHVPACLPTAITQLTSSCVVRGLQLTTVKYCVERGVTFFD